MQLCATWKPDVGDLRLRRRRFFSATCSLPYLLRTRASLLMLENWFRTFGASNPRPLCCFHLWSISCFSDYLHMHSLSLIIKFTELLVCALCFTFYLQARWRFRKIKYVNLKKPQKNSWGSKASIWDIRIAILENCNFGNTDSGRNPYSVLIIGRKLGGFMRKKVITRKKKSDWCWTTLGYTEGLLILSSDRSATSPCDQDICLPADFTNNCDKAQSEVSRNKMTNAVPLEWLLWRYFKMAPFMSFFTSNKEKATL